MDESPISLATSASASVANGVTPTITGGIGGNGCCLAEIAMPLSPPTSPASYEHPLSMQRDLGPATELPERVWAECIVGSGGHCRASSPSGGKVNGGEPPSEIGSWNFVDPTCKSSCSCSK